MDEADLLRQFGRRVRQLRGERSVTQEELAHRMGRTVEMVSKIERGRVWVSFKTLCRISTALAVEPVELFRFDELAVPESPFEAPGLPR